jgi:hypothetical protein
MPCAGRTRTRHCWDALAARGRNHPGGPGCSLGRARRFGTSRISPRRRRSRGAGVRLDLAANYKLRGGPLPPEHHTSDNNPAEYLAGHECAHHRSRPHDRDYQRNAADDISLHPQYISPYDGRPDNKHDHRDPRYRRAPARCPVDAPFDHQTAERPRQPRVRRSLGGGLLRCVGDSGRPLPAHPPGSGLKEPAVALPH